LRSSVIAVIEVVAELPGDAVLALPSVQPASPLDDAEGEKRVEPRSELNATPTGIVPLADDYDLAEQEAEDLGVVALGQRR
jgi:hypothetical protein